MFGILISLLSAIALHSAVGLLFGLIVVIPHWKATQFINATPPGIIDLAKAAIADAGSKRVGVDLEASDCRVLAIAQDSSSPFGVRHKPDYHLSAVYICDAFFATFSGNAFSLPDCALAPGTTGDEIYFRHVTAINYRDTLIEIAFTRNKKPKLIEVGSEENGAVLLEVLRARLRNPASPLQQLAASVAPTPQEYLERETITHTARNDGDDQRYCYIRSTKLMEYYSDVAVLTALLAQLQVPGTSTSSWYGIAPQEVLAASIWRARVDLLSERVINDKFYDVAREENLRRPVAR